MADILIYNSGSKVATTSKAFDILVKKELMRSRTLDFSIVNTDNARQFIIPNAVFQAEGQNYNLTDFVSESGSNNITSVSAEHVSYELNDYVVPVGYAFVGTVTAILQDMLTQSFADAKFTVGTCAGVSGSLALNNTQDMNLRAAILRLVSLGVEVDFDNYAINLPVQVGVNNGKIFQFGRDLVDFKRTYNKAAGTMTYEIGIATLMRLPDALSSDTFAVGDTVIIADSILGDQITQRIVCYDKHLDDPTQDAVTIGAFIPDSSDTTAAMQVGISNSVQQEAAYSNVSIDHVNGFMAVNAAGTIGVKMNATNCFAVYSISGGVWTLLSELDADGLKANSIIIDTIIGGENVNITISPEKPFELSFNGLPIAYLTTAGVWVTSRYDINEDGVVDVYDYKMIKDAILNLIPKTPRMDLNGDGLVNSTDATLWLIANRMAATERNFGYVTLNDTTWTTVTFGEQMVLQPVIQLTPYTENAGAITAKVRNVTQFGFEAIMAGSATASEFAWLSMA